MKQYYYGLLLSLLLFLKLNETTKDKYKLIALFGVIYILYKLFQNEEGWVGGGVANCDLECSGNGTCQPSPSPHCVCSPGWTGTNCSSPSPPPQIVITATASGGPSQQQQEEQVALEAEQLQQQEELEAEQMQQQEELEAEQLQQQGEQEQDANNICKNPPPGQLSRGGVPERAAGRPDWTRPISEDSCPSSPGKCNLSCELFYKSSSPSVEYICSPSPPSLKWNPTDGDINCELCFALDRESRGLTFFLLFVAAPLLIIAWCWSIDVIIKSAAINKSINKWHESRVCRCAIFLFALFAIIFNFILLAYDSIWTREFWNNLTFGIIIIIFLLTFLVVGWALHADKLIDVADFAAARERGNRKRNSAAAAAAREPVELATSAA